MPMPRTSPTSGSTPSSIAARNRPESPRSTTASSSSSGRWGTSRTSSTRRASRGSPAEAAIGHVRYSTAGDSSLSNAQPIVFSSGRGPLALAHNGNLVNAKEIRAHLEEEGALFTTNSDSEMILHLVARSKRDSLSAALVEALGEVRGRVLDRRARPERDPRRARPERLPAARAGDARRRPGRRVRNLRLRSDRRDVRPRRRGGRGREALGGRRRVDSLRLSPSDACASSSTSTSRGRIRSSSGSPLPLRGKPSARSSRRSTRSPPTSSSRFPTPARTRRSGTRGRRGSRSRSGSSAITTSAARSSSRSRRSGASGSK